MPGSCVVVPPEDQDASTEAEDEKIPTESVAPNEGDHFDAPHEGIDSP